MLSVAEALVCVEAQKRITALTALEHEDLPRPDVGLDLLGREG